MVPSILKVVSGQRIQKLQSCSRYPEGTWWSNVSKGYLVVQCTQRIHNGPGMQGNLAQWDRRWTKQFRCHSNLNLIELCISFMFLSGWIFIQSHHFICRGGTAKCSCTKKRKYCNTNIAVCTLPKKNVFILHLTFLKFFYLLPR